MFNFFAPVDENNYDEIMNDIKDGKAQLIDIRENNEWNSNRFACAVNVPLSGLSRGIGIDQLTAFESENKKVYLHCHTGSRVQMAKRMLPSFGLNNFSIIPISMMEMSRKGFSLVA